MKLKDLFFAALLTCFVSPSVAEGPVREKLIDEEIRREDVGDFAGAMEVAKKILETSPRDVETLNVIAGLYGKLGRYEEEVIWANKAIAIDQNFHLAHVNLGNALFYLGKFEEARRAFETAMRLAPRDPLPVYSLGTLAEEQQHLQEAISYFERSIKLEPKFQPGMFSLAAMYANAKRYPPAIAMLDRLILLNPSAHDAISMRKRIRIEAKRSKQ